MSEYYPQFPHTNFPDAIDAWEDVVDVDLSTLGLVSQYNHFFASGDIQAAQQLLIDNPDLVKIIINADKMNQMQQAIMALETIFTEDIDVYLAQASMPKGMYDPNNVENDAFSAANHSMVGYREISEYSPPDEGDSTLSAIEKLVAGIATNAQQIAALQGAIIYIGNIPLSSSAVTQTALTARATELGYTTLITGHTLVDLSNANWWYNAAQSQWINIGKGIEQATNTTAGIVQGSTTAGKVSVGSDGTMTANSVMLSTGGTFTGMSYAQSNTSLNAQLRNIQLSTTDLTAGSSALTSGHVYFVFE